MNLWAGAMFDRRDVSGRDEVMTACIQALGTQQLTRQALSQGLSHAHPSVLGSWRLKQKLGLLNSYPGMVPV